MLQQFGTNSQVLNHIKATIQKIQDRNVRWHQYNFEGNQDIPVKYKMDT